MCGSVYREASWRLQIRGKGTGRGPLRGPEAADLLCTGTRVRPEDPHTGRGYEFDRYRDRAADPTGGRPSHARPDVARCGAPAINDPEMRPDHGLSPRRT